MSGALEDTFKCATCDKWIKDIVALIDHAGSGCERVLHVDALSPNEQSTLMYIESCIADKRGKVDREKMNFEDDQNIKLFAAAGLLDLKERMPEPPSGPMIMEVVEFTDEAWELAAECRKQRGKRALQEHTDG